MAMYMSHSMNVFVSTLIMTVGIFLSPTATGQEMQDIETLFEEGVNKIQFGEYEQALTYFDKILELDPENVKALMNKASVLISLKKHSDAICYFDKVLEIEPKNVDALYNKATVLSYIKEYDEAFSYFDRVLEIDPENLEVIVAKTNIPSREILESSKAEKPIIKKIYLQMSVWNSNGNLVTYIETEDIVISDLYPDDYSFLNRIFELTCSKWTDSNEEFVTMNSITRESVTINGQDFKLVTIHTSGDFFGHSIAVSKPKLFVIETDLGWHSLLVANVDSYILTSGDRYDILWKVLRPID